MKLQIRKLANAEKRLGFNGSSLQRLPDWVNYWVGSITVDKEMKKTLICVLHFKETIDSLTYSINLTNNKKETLKLEIVGDIATKKVKYFVELNNFLMGIDSTKFTKFGFGNNKDCLKFKQTISTFLRQGLTNSQN